MVDVQLPVAAGQLRCRRLPRRTALGELFIADVQVQAALGHVELDQVAVLHQRERPAGRGLGRGVQHHGAVGGAAHARVADAHHVGDALLQHLGRQRHVADLGHAGVALGPAVLQHQDAVLVDVEVGVVDARVEVVAVLEHHRAAVVHHQRRRRGARLDHRAARRQVAAQHADAGVRLERLRHRLDDARVEVLRVGDVLAHGLAAGGDVVEVQRAARSPSSPPAGRRRSRSPPSGARPKAAGSPGTASRWRAARSRRSSASRRGGRRWRSGGSPRWSSRRSRPAS